MLRSFPRVKLSITLFYYCPSVAYAAIFNGSWGLKMMFQILRFHVPFWQSHIPVNLFYLFY